MFENMTNEGHEKTEDRLGGFSKMETDIYLGTVKVAYGSKAASGAMAVNLILDINGQEHRETVYVSNKKGETYFLNKDDNTKKVSLPGFTLINDLCLVAAGVTLAGVTTEDKIINIYDFEQKKEMPKSVPVITDLLGKKAFFAITKQIVNVNEKKGDEYVATAKTREENVIDKVFEEHSRMTVSEAIAANESGKTGEAKFFDAWKERNEGKTRDKRSIKDGSAGASSGPPKSGSTTATRPSLFGNR
jgi:hypothetical protein